MCSLNWGQARHVQPQLGSGLAGMADGLGLGLGLALGVEYNRGLYVWDVIVRYDCGYVPRGTDRGQGLS